MKNVNKITNKEIAQNIMRDGRIVGQTMDTDGLLWIVHWKGLIIRITKKSGKDRYNIEQIGRIAQ